MQIRIHALLSLRDVAFALVRRDVPEIPCRILNRARPFAVLLILHRIHESRTSTNRTLTGGVSVFDIEVQSTGLHRAREFLAGNPATHHDQRVANSYFPVHARWHHRSQGFFGVENFLCKIEHRWAIRSYEVWCHHPESRTDRFPSPPAGRCPTTLRAPAKALHTLAHLLSRHLFLHREHAPGVPERILQRRVSMSIELISRCKHQSHALSFRMPGKCVHIRHLNRHRDRGTSQRFSAESPTLGPFPRYIDMGIADDKLGVRDLPANFETERFFRVQSTFVEFNRFGRIPERQPWRCGGTDE